MLRHDRVTSVLIGASNTSQLEDAVGMLANRTFGTEELPLLWRHLSCPIAPPAQADGLNIDLMPGVSLRIGDQDNRGNYWDGYDWRDRDYWRKNYYYHDGRYCKYDKYYYKYYNKQHHKKNYHHEHHHDD